MRGKLIPWIVTAAVASLCVSVPVPTRAGPAPESLDTLRARANIGTVGIVTGGIDGTYARIATDLAAVLDSDKLRVLPLIGKGSLQNIRDLFLLRGIDIGIVQSDALAYAERQKLFPGVERAVQYIAKLYNEEVHLLARRDIATVQDLAGKPVNIDVPGSGTAMTATLILERLKIAVDPKQDDQALALEKLRRGEIAALVYIAGKPARLFRDLKPEDGLHFLSLPPEPLLDAYLPSRLTHEEYATLVPDGGSVETVAVGAVMAVYNWPAASERHQKVARFVEAFFGNFDALLQAPRHPKWREVNLDAQVPGWKRFGPAEAWLQKTRAPGAQTAAAAAALRKEFDAFLDRTERAGSARASGEQRDALFHEFVRLREQMLARR